MNPNPYFPNLEQELKRALDRHLSDRSDWRIPPKLIESIQYSLLAPGKRIRPRLALASARMMGLRPEAALCAALALEMVHCYTLIHDDLPCMDDDDYRRGRLSNHKKFGEAIALLAGDSLMPLAYDVLLDAAPYVSPQGLVAGLKRLSWAMGPRGVIAGQAAEMDLTEQSTIDDLRQMHAQKTGALFAAALLLPADLAGLDEGTPRAKAIAVFARELGLAFQIADDLEDAAQDVVITPETAIEKPAAPAPNNVLFFLPEHDARMLTLDGLSRAKRELLCNWEEASEPLILIAEEVSKKLGGSS